MTWQVSKMKLFFLYECPGSGINVKYFVSLSYWKSGLDPVILFESSKNSLTICHVVQFPVNVPPAALKNGNPPPCPWPRKANGPQNRSEFIDIILSRGSAMSLTAAMLNSDKFIPLPCSYFSRLTTRYLSGPKYAYFVYFSRAFWMQRFNWSSDSSIVTSGYPNETNIQSINSFFVLIAGFSHVDSA